MQRDTPGCADMAGGFCHINLTYPKTFRKKLHDIAAFGSIHTSWEESALGVLK